MLLLPPLLLLTLCSLPFTYAVLVNIDPGVFAGVDEHLNYMYSDNNANWEEARSICRANNLYLSVPESCYILLALRDNPSPLVQDDSVDYWVDLERKGHYPLNSRDKPTPCSLKFTPDSEQTGCLALVRRPIGGMKANLMYRIANCTEEKRFLCQDEMVSPCEEDKDVCDGRHRTRNIDDICYWTPADRKISVSYLDAASACDELGGRLLSIRSQAEWTAIRSDDRLSEDFEEFRYVNYWLSLKRRPWEDVERWQEDGFIAYDFWDDSRFREDSLSSLKPDGACVVFNPETETFRTYPCVDSINVNPGTIAARVICELPVLEFCEENLQPVRNAYAAIDKSSKSIIYKCRKGYFFDIDEEEEPDINYSNYYDDDDLEFHGYDEEEEEEEEYYKDYYLKNYRYAKVECDCKETKRPPDCVPLYCQDCEDGPLGGCRRYGPSYSCYCNPGYHMVYRPGKKECRSDPDYGLYHLKLELDCRTDEIDEIREGLEEYFGEFDDGPFCKDHYRYDAEGSFVSCPVGVWPDRRHLSEAVYMFYDYLKDNREFDADDKKCYVNSDLYLWGFGKSVQIVSPCSVLFDDGYCNDWICEVEDNRCKTTKKCEDKDAVGPDCVRPRPEVWRRLDIIFLVLIICIAVIVVVITVASCSMCCRPRASYVTSPITEPYSPGPMVPRRYDPNVGGYYKSPSLYYHI